MATQDPFFSSALGDPRHLNERWAVQADNDIPTSDPSAFHDVRTYGGTPQVTMKEVPRLAFASGMPERSLEGPMEVSDTSVILGDADMGNWLQPALLACLLQRYDAASSGDAHTYTIHASGATAGPRQFTRLINKDTGVIERWHSEMPKMFTLAGSPGGNLKLGVTTVQGKMDVHGPSTQETGSGSTLPELRQTLKIFSAAAPTVSGAIAPDASDVDLYLKVISLVSTTGAVIQAKVGASGSYGSSFTVTFGTWCFIPALGKRAEQPQVYWPSGATLTALDVFKVEKRRQPWTPTFAPFRSIGLTQTRIYLAGRQIGLDGGFTMTFTLADVKRLMAMERQATGTERFGVQNTVISLNREMIDRQFQNYLLDQSVITLVIEGISDMLIGSSTTPYGLTIVAPSLQATGPMWHIGEGGTDRKEALQLTASRSDTAYNWNGVDYTDDVNAIVTTDLTTLAA